MENAEKSPMWKLIASFAAGIAVTAIVVFAVGGNSNLFKGQFYGIQEIGTSGQTCNECEKLEHLIRVFNNYTAAFNNFTNGMNNYTRGMGNYTEGMKKYTESMTEFTRSLDNLPRVVDQLTLELAQPVNSGFTILQ